MKNILLALLLANILYFMWGFLSDDDAQPGVAIVDETELGPSLDIISDRGGDEVASAGALLGSGESSTLAAVVGRSCITLGPFRESTDADSAVLEYSNEGMRSARRSEIGEIFVGHWVWVRNVADAAEANGLLDRLKAGGLGDAYLDRTEPDDLKISLGLFGDVSGAEQIEQQARALDIPAEIIPSTRERELYFVDIALPSGKGATAIVDRFGEDKVLLADKATCPGN